MTSWTPGRCRSRPAEWQPESTRSLCSRRSTLSRPCSNSRQWRRLERQPWPILSHASRKQVSLTAENKHRALVAKGHSSMMTWQTWRMNGFLKETQSPNLKSHRQSLRCKEVWSHLLPMLINGECWPSGIVIGERRARQYLFTHTVTVPITMTPSSGATLKTATIQFGPAGLVCLPQGISVCQPPGAI